MNKKLLTTAVAVMVSCVSLSAFAEHEWSTCSGGIENDLWTLGGTWNNGTLTVNTATPKDGTLTTLDVSNINIGGKTLKAFNCWQKQNITTVKKLIVPDWTLTFNIQASGMPGLEELCTTNGSHRLSISSWNNGIVNTGNFAGDYQIVDVGSGTYNQTFYSTKVNNVEITGAFADLGQKALFLCPDLETAAFNTTATITAIPDWFCGYWGDQDTPATTYKLTSLTLNGNPLLRSSAITAVGYQSVTHCTRYSDIIDLPNCTSVGTYGLRGNSSVPFANFMSLTSAGRSMLRDYTALDRVVFGTKSQMTLASNAETFCASFTTSSSPSIIWNSSTAPSGIVESMFWNIDNYKLTNYVRKEARSGWDTAVAAIPKMKQNFVSMDTSFKVYLRCTNEVLMTTLMPGVSGENSTWTIPSKWFFPSGTTFGVGSVKDAGGNVISGASATPDGSGLNLTITLPASAVETGDETQDVEIYVDMVPVVKTDAAITVVINDASDNEILRDSFEVSFGGSAIKDYSDGIFQTNKYFYSQVISTTVSPADSLTATFDLTARLSLENVMKDATVTIKINRIQRPEQKNYWEVAADGYSMSDGPWTFRCDFNNGRAVIANPCSYIGSDIDALAVDFSKPVKQNENVLTIKNLDWGAEINGSAIDLTKNNYGKNIVINGSAATANTLINALVLPSYSVDAIAGWGGCSKLVVAAEDITSIATNIGKYAFCGTKVAGSLSFADSDVVTLGDYAFDGCGDVTSVTVRKHGSTIGKYAFRQNTKMTSADLGGVVSIGDYAFWKTPVTTLTLCPVLREYSPFVFAFPSSSLSMSVVPPTREMFAVPVVNSRIGEESFRDYRGQGAIIVPFRGSVTNVAVNAFKWLGPCTNIVFWGKAPAPDAFDVKAFSELGSSDYTRRITGSRALDESGWTNLATPCTSEEKALASYPGDDVCFGTHTFSDVKFWMCWGVSPWEKSISGLLIIVR